MKRQTKIRRQTNLKFEHNRALKALGKKGITGLLIVEHDNEILASIIGAEIKGLYTTHRALIGVDWLYALCKSVLDPKITVTKDSDESIHAEEE